MIHDDHRYSVLSMADVLAKSSNIGAIQIALKTGERPLYKYQRLFGFGQKTGIELAGESGGNLRDVKQWMPSSIGSLAMGHEVSVTSLQLAVAGAVIANGGLKVKPRLVIARQKPGQPVQRIRCRAAGADSASGDGHHHAPDDGGRGAARHRPRPREPERVYLGRQDRIGADLRRQGARLHAQLQRELPGFRAGGESANRDRRDAEPHHRR